MISQKIYELVSCKRKKLAHAPIEDSDQPVLSCSLIRVFDRHSMGSQKSRGGDPGFLESGYICIKVRGFALLIFSHFS